MTFGVRIAPQSRRAIQLFSIAAFLLISRLGSNSYALDAREYAVEASVEVLNSPFRLRLAWRPSGLVRSYTIRRRDYTSADWGSARATLPSGSSEYIDTQVAEGQAYEYEIQAETTVASQGGWVNAYGYILAGSKVSWPDQKGKVLVLVDPLLLPTLNLEIDKFQKNLIGSGWTPIRRDFERLSTVSDVKNVIRAEYNADRANLRGVVILGHLPVPYSGNIAPDLHASHKGAWPADVYYGEMDGTWTDSTVDIVSADSPLNNNRPGDGKFDQSQIPSHVELEVGRIDFANLPTFSSSTATDLVRRYLQKNHDFRHRVFTSTRRGLIRDNFGDLDGDAPAVDAWRHYPQFFGPGQLREVGPGGFFSTLNNESFLWAYGCGGGGNNKADGVGTTLDFATHAPRAVFLVLHGSYFGDWNVSDNFLRAGIASSGHTLASIWSGLPHWYMHPMGLGASVGFCTRLSQNNILQYKSHQNISAQQVHVSLIGDPTLEMLPVIPPRNLAGSASANVNLTWLPSTDDSIVGYHLYHASSASGPFNRITASPVTATTYAHPAGSGTHHYMVRAVKLERTGSGTFYNLSQGIFASVTKTSGGVTPQVTIDLEDANVSEAGPNTGTVRISRNVADENPLTVELTIGGSAQNGIDYSSIPPSVVIPGWGTDARLSIVPTADNILEGTENLSIQIKPSVSYTIGSPPSVVVDILDLNRPPTISEISNQTLESGTSSAELFFDISDPETQPAALQLRAQSSNPELIHPSAIVLEGSGATRSIQIAATNSGTGVATITLILSDGVNEVSRSFNVTVTAPNLPPVAHSQNVATIENQALPITLVGQDPEGQALSFLVQSSPANGILSGTAPNLTYTPSSNFFGVDSFTFTVHDGRRASPPATVVIAISELNRPPVASGRSAETIEDRPVIIELIGSDPNSDSLTFEIVVQPAKGLLSGTNNVFQYFPNTNAFGSDSFSFRVRDSEFVSAPAIVHLNIVPTNDPPSALTRQLWLEEDETLYITLEGTDPDDDDLTFLISNAPTNGVLSGTPPKLIYTPGTNFSGQDAIQFTVTDGVATSALATVSFEISPVNDTPAALNQIFSLEEDEVRVLTLQGRDADGDALSFHIVSPPTNGFVFGTAPQLTYRPNTNFHGTDTLEYIVSDGSATSSVATVSFTVNPINDPPVIGPIEDQTIRKNYWATALGFGLSDVETLIYNLMFTAESSNTGLIATNNIRFEFLGTNPVVTLVPTHGMTGTARITLKVDDGEAAASTSFTLTVTNSVPSPIYDYITALSGLVTLPVSTLLTNDWDSDLDPLKIISVSDSLRGHRVVLTNDTIIYYGDGAGGQDSFNYTVEDTSQDRATAALWLTLTANPQVSSVTVAGDNVILRITGEPHRFFNVWSSLDTTEWENIGSGTSSAMGRAEFTHVNGANPAHHRFYRIEWP